MRLYGEIIPRFSEGIIDRTGAQTMHYLTCTMIPSVNLAQYGVSCATEWISVDCGTIQRYLFLIFNIVIKQGFPCINVCQVPREMLQTEAEGRGFQHLPRDLANVNVLENNV